MEGVGDVPSVVELVLLLDPELKVLKLGEVVASDLEAILPAVDVLEALFEGPFELPHEISDDDGGGPGFAVDGMHQAALAPLLSFLDEGVEGVEGIILFIEDLNVRMRYIGFPFSPADREVVDAEVLPEVRNFVGDCVDDVGDFVADYEFDVLHFGSGTLAASSSPMNSPSLILTGPRVSSWLCSVCPRFIKY